MLGHVPKLPNAPLKEVIFEIRWKLEVDKESGLAYDKNLNKAIGKFENLVSSYLSYYINLKPPIVGEHFFAHRAIHQFWRAENVYPVMQLGPGIFTVNETEINYRWDEFKARIQQGLEWLTSSYRDLPQLTSVELRYIDAVELTGNEIGGLLQYLDEHLNVQIRNKVNIDGTITDFQLAQKFQLPNGSTLNLLFGSGIKNDKTPVIIWHTSVTHYDGLTLTNLNGWLESAHDQCSNFFRQTISTKLYEQFNQQ